MDINTGLAAQKAGIDTEQLRRLAIYKADESKVIEVLTNNLEWSAGTIAELYKRRWDIETFFMESKRLYKAILENLSQTPLSEDTSHRCLTFEEPRSETLYMPEAISLTR